MGVGSVSPFPASSEVPDVLAPRLAVVFCGINPGRVSAAARAHFANPRNDFWRLLHAAGFTPRLFEPQEQSALLELGIGVTNAAYRTTPGSGDLRRADFDRARLETIARELRPRAIAFVGKEAYRGVFGSRPDLGPQTPTLDDAGLFVLPSTSPANAAVPYAERLRSPGDEARARSSRGARDRNRRGGDRRSPVSCGRRRSSARPPARAARTAPAARRGAA